LGQPYTHAVDVWSVGCTLYELFTGKVLFTGKNNNEILKAQCTIIGKFSNKFVRKGIFRERHFDDSGVFLSLEEDKITHQHIIKQLEFKEDPGGLGRLIRATAYSKADEEHIKNFKDLLEKCLAPDPANRITPNDALQHKFIVDFQSGKKKK